MIKVDLKKTGSKIRKQMHIADIESDTLAKRLGYADRSTVNRWTRGQSMPSYENLINMTRILGCKIRDLVEIYEE